MNRDELKALPDDLPLFCLDAMEAQLATFGVEPVCNIEGARTVLAAWNTRASANDAGLDLVERVARAICLARCVGNQKPDDLMGTQYLPSYERTPPYRWQLSIQAAEAAIAAMPDQSEVVEALRIEDIISAWAFAHNIDGAARNDLFARIRAALAKHDDRGGQ